jgi:hypothetical protein
MSGAAAGLPLPCPFVVPLVNGFTSRREIVSCWVLVSLLEPVELLQLETLHRQHHALDAAAVERALRRAFHHVVDGRAYVHPPVVGLGV